jgi:hypothetical protein
VQFVSAWFIGSYSRLVRELTGMTRIKYNFICCIEECLYFRLSAWTACTVTDSTVSSFCERNTYFALCMLCEN